MIWLQLAWRDLRRNRRRSGFAIGITALGSVATLAAAGYMLSTFVAVRESTVRGGVGHLQIARAKEFGGYEERVLEHGLSAGELGHIRRATEGVRGIELVLPRLAFQGLVSSGERTLVALAEGVDPMGERRLSALFVPVVSGRGLESEAAPPAAALLGREMARLLGVVPGDPITLLTMTVSGGLNAVDAEVVGTFATGTPELDRMRVLVPLPLAQELLQTSGARRVAIGLRSTADTDAIRRELQARLPALAVRTWYELSPFYRQLVGLYSRQAAVLGVVIAAVVLLAVFSSVATGVMERKRDIGTLMSLGIPARRIRRLFLLEGGLLGLLGGAAGAAFALAILLGVNAADVRMPPPPGQTESYRLHIAYEPRIALAITLAMMALGIAAGWVASRHVTQRSVIEAMARE